MQGRELELVGEIPRFFNEQGGRAHIEFISVPTVKEYELKARLRRMVDRGEIYRKYAVKQEGGELIATVLRLKRRARRYPWVLAGVAISLGFLGSVVYTVWEHRHVIAMGALALAFAAAIVIRFLAGHNVGCAGLHCPGCRG